MATASPTQRHPGPAPERFRFYDIGWDGYQSLLKMVENRRVHVSYYRGTAELTAPVFLRERYKSMLNSVVSVVTQELEIPLVFAGSTTFNRRDRDCGLEPDESYYLSSIERLCDPWAIDLDRDPPPDLAIEITSASGTMHRLRIYATLGVPEVWRFDGEALSVLLLQADETYAPHPRSAAFPFLPIDQVSRFLLSHDLRNDTPWVCSFRARVRAVIVPKVRGGEG